jgi:hypothetical protein
MRILICFLAVILCDCVFAQDPTVPSAQILERLQAGQTTPAVTLHTSRPTAEERLPPVLKLKAMVMTDSDHGTALIEVDGRRVRVRLSRSTTDKSEASSEIGIDGLVIQGSTYHVQSFSVRSILLTNHSQALSVQ